MNYITNHMLPFSIITHTEALIHCSFWITRQLITSNTYAGTARANKGTMKSALCDLNLSFKFNRIDYHKSNSSYKELISFLCQNAFVWSINSLMHPDFYWFCSLKMSTAKSWIACRSFQHTFMNKPEHVITHDFCDCKNGFSLYSSKLMEHCAYF